jgi:uncharacterized UPF0160 family protein
MNVNTNTINNNVISCRDLELPFNEALLTANEKLFIEKGWDGEACLKTALRFEDVVAVHDGEFHSDEVLSLALLVVFAGLDPEQRMRTRDPKKLMDADLRVDVGEGLLDHHGARATTGVAACSRVFALLRNTGVFRKLALSTRAVDALVDLVDRVAAVDTGDPNAEGHWIIDMVQTFNRATTVITGEDFFDRAVAAVVDALQCIIGIADAEAIATNAALDAIVAADGDAVVAFPAEARAAKCKELLWKHAKDCVYYVSPESPDDWRILCAAAPEVSPADGKAFAFSSRRLIPERFRGLRGEQLSEVTGIDGGIFSHAAGFIAGFKTREAAIHFAVLCLRD